MANTIASSGPEPEVGHRDAGQRQRHRRGVDGGAAPHGRERCRAASRRRSPRASPRRPVRRWPARAPPICCATGSPVRSDVPRSPRASPARNAPYCSSSGRSSPSRLRSSSTSACERGFAQHRLRRIAGNEVNEGEDQRRDAEQDRDRQHEPPREVTSHAQDSTSARGRGRARRARAISFEQALTREPQLAGGLRRGAGRHAPAPPAPRARRSRVARRRAQRRRLARRRGRRCARQERSADAPVARRRHGQRGHHVLQLAHVARPVVAAPAPPAASRPSVAREPTRAGGRAPEVLGQHRHVLAAARAAAAPRCGSRRAGRAGRGGTRRPRPPRAGSRLAALTMRTSIRRMRASPSRRTSCCWSTRSSFACARDERSDHLVQEQRAAVARPRTGRRDRRAAPVNAPRAWPKSSDSTQLVGQRRAVHVAEALRCARALSAMEGARHELLPDTALAVDQHGEGRRRGPHHG